MRYFYGGTLALAKAAVLRNGLFDAIAAQSNRATTWARAGLLRRTARLAFMASFCLMLCSCLNPYVEPNIITYCPPSLQGQLPKASCQDLTSTTNAVGMIHTSIDQVDTKLSANVDAGKVLDYATFGLGAAFAVKAAHGTKLAIGSRNVAIAAGTAYTGRSLFASSDVNALYLSAESNLVCVANRGNNLMAAYDQASGITANETSDIAQIIKGCGLIIGNKLDKATIDAMLGSYAKMEQAIATVKSLDGAIAVQLNSASTNIIATLNSQLSANEPSPQAILNAGAEANAIATNIVGGGATPTPGSTLYSGDVCPGTDQEVNDFKTLLDGATSAIVTELNAIGDLKDGCATVTNALVVPLSVSPASIILKQGSNSTLVILGGRAPFTVAWNKASQPTNAGDVPFQMIAGTNLIMISATAKAKANTTPYELHVSDSSAVTAATDVSIEVVSQK